MPGTVYTVASGKGGVGKTTTSVNLAVALWREGNAVALVDADIGMANLAAVLDLAPEDTLHDVLAGRATVEDAVIEAKDGDLMVLPGDRSLDSFAEADPNALRAAVSDLAARADYVIVDTGAGLSYEDVLPLGMADGVVLVTTPDPAAFGDTMKTMEVADLLGAPIRGLVVTRAVEDTDSAAIAAEIGAELLGTIPEDPAVMASTVAGDPLESHAPDSGAAAAYRDLADAVLSGDEAWLAEHAREPADGATAAAGAAGSGTGAPAETPPAGEASPGTDEVEDSATAPGDDEPAVEAGTDGPADEPEAGEPAEESPSGVDSPAGADDRDEPAADEDAPVPEEPGAVPPEPADSDETTGEGESPEPGADSPAETAPPGDEPDSTEAVETAGHEGSGESVERDESERADVDDSDAADEGAAVDDEDEAGGEDEEGAVEEDDATDAASETADAPTEVPAEDADGGEDDGQEATDDDGASGDDGTSGDDGANAAEKRGGFFGWLGRLFS